MMVDLTPQDYKLIDSFVLYTINQELPPSKQIKDFNNIEGAPFTPEEIEYKRQIAEMTYKKAKEYNIEPILFLSIIHRESSLGTTDPINVAQVKDALIDYQNKVDPKLKKITTPEQSLEVGAWYLKEQLPSSLRFELLKNPDRRTTPEAQKNMEDFENEIAQLIGVDPENKQELEKSFETALKEQVSNPTNEELFALLIGGYNEGPGNISKAQASTGDFWSSKASKSDEDTTWSYARKVINPIVDFASKSNYTNINIDLLPEKPSELKVLDQKQPKVTTGLPPLADLGFTGITPEAAPLTTPEPLEIPQVDLEIPQVTPEVAQEMPQVTPKVAQEEPTVSQQVPQVTPAVPTEEPRVVQQVPMETQEAPEVAQSPKNLPPLASLGGAMAEATPPAVSTELPYGGDVRSVIDFWKTVGLAAVYKEPKDSLLDPAVETVAQTIGNLGREIALVVTSYGLANTGIKAAQGISWVSKAANKTPVIAKEAIRGTTAGAIKTGLSAVLGQDISWYDAAINMAQFGGGDFARSVSQTLLKDTAVVSPVIKELIGYVSDVVGGATLALGIHGEVDEYVKEIIAPQTVAMGVVDLLFWGATKGKLDLDTKAVNDIVQAKMDIDSDLRSPSEALKELDAKLRELEIDISKLPSEYEKALQDNLKVSKVTPEAPKEPEVTPKVTPEEPEVTPKVSQKETRIPTEEPKFSQEEPKISEKLTEPSETAKKVAKLVESEVPYEDVGAPRVTPRKDKAPINTTRINSDDGTINEVYNMAKAIEETEGKPTKTFEEIKKAAGDMTGEGLAKELGINLKEAKALQEAIEKAPEQITAYRELIVSLGKQAQHQAQYIQELQKKGEIVPEVEKIKLQQILTYQAELTKSTKDISTRIAQSLAAHRIEVDGKLYDVSELRDWDIFKNPDALGLYEAYSKAGIDEKTFNQLVERLANTTDIAEVTQIAQKTSLNILEFIESYRGSNLLLNPNTHMRNLLSQFIHQVQETTIDFTEAFVSKLKGSPEDAMTFHEAVSRLSGTVEGMINAWKRPIVSTKDIYGITHNVEAPSVMDLIKLLMFNPKEFEKIYSMTQIGVSRAQAESLNARFSGHNLFGRFSEANTIMKGMTNTIDYFASVQRLLSYGLLQAGDKPFAYAGYLSEVNGKIDQLIRKGTISKTESEAVYNATKAYRQQQMLKDALEEAAARQGIPEMKIPDYVNQKYQEMGIIVPEKYTGLVTELDKAGLAKANEMTWKTAPETKLGKASERFINSVPAIKIFQPFIRTPTKILEYAMYTSGLTGKFWEDIRSGDVRRNSRAIAALTVSGSLYGLGGLLYSQGKLTPSARNAEERERMNQAGLQENSIKIGDSWVNINVLDPAPAWYFTTAANIYREVEEAINSEDYPEAEAKAFDFLTIVANLTLDKTWFQGVEDLVNALTGYGSERYFQNLAQTFVPGYGYESFFRQKFGDYLIDLNGAVMKGQPRLDVFGKPIVNYDYKFGLRVMEETDSPIRQELYNLGINLSSLNAVSYNMELTPEEHYEMIRYLDTHLHAEDRLNQLVSTPAYQASSDATKRKMILKLWNSMVDQAKAYGASLAAKRGALEESTEEQLEELTEPPSEGSRYFKAPTPESQKQAEEILNWGQK